MANDEYSGQDANTDADAESTVDSAPEQQDPDSVEPSPEAGIMPVVRPAVTLPNPDVQARQIAPQVPEPETAPQEPVPTSVLSTGEEDTDTVTPLRDLPNEQQEAAYAQEKVDPDTRKFPTLTTWQQAFQRPADSQAPSEIDESTDRASYPGDYAPHTEPLPTQAIRLADRLHDSPYQLTGARYKAAAEAKDAHNTMLLALKLGETMFKFGAGALEVETSIIVVTQTYGVFDAEVDITNQSISLNFAPAGAPPATYQRVVRSWSSDYGGLADLHQLVSGIAAGQVERDDAQAQLAAIRHRRKTFPQSVAFIANGVWASAFVMFIGGSWFSALLSLGASTLSIATVYLIGRLRAPEVFSTMAGGIMATVIAYGLYWTEIFRDPALMITSALMLLVPSLRIVSAVQDGINGFPITSAGRIVSSVLIYVGVVAGIVLSIVVFAKLGAPAIDVTKMPDHQYPYWFVAILVGIAAMGASIADQTRWQLIIPTGMVSVIGYLVYIAAIEIGFGPSIAPAAAAVVLGFFARIVGLSLGAPQLVIAVPASIFLLPGLMIFRAMYTMGSNVEMMSDGVAGLIQGSIIIMAMATGLVLGDSLARPFTSGLKANERRSIGRR